MLINEHWSVPIVTDLIARMVIAMIKRVIREENKGAGLRYQYIRFDHDNGVESVMLVNYRVLQIRLDLLILKGLEYMTSFIKCTNG